jgi:signal transduction histidine kinase/pSer/pThr/pTyr-binding forkhead associated (FHA) protein
VLTLLVLQGPDKGRRFELPDAPTLVGRESRQLPITDNTVSRRHCELYQAEDDSWMIKDLGSANGTWINGQRVERTAPLRLGDQIRVGRTILVFGAQPGVSRGRGGDVRLVGVDAMDSSIMHAIPSSEDSMVLAVPEPAAAAMANLKLLYQLNASLGSSFDIDQVLEVVMDLVFEHVKADRGIILTIDEKRNGELIPKIVRVRDETTPGGAPGAKRPPHTHPAPPHAHAHPLNRPQNERIPIETSSNPTVSLPPPPANGNGEETKQQQAEKIHASRTIINYVIEKGEGVLSSNAMTDARFSKGKSVHNLGIRSALCVPIKCRRIDGKEGDDIIGVIYIDSSVKNYTYSPDQLRLLTAIGLQAGLAVQNAKLYQQGLQAERLAAIGETTAALSHSIKNILQALRGGADVVEMGLRNNNTPQLTKGWRVVDRNLEKIYNLTMNLLAYSKEREPKLEFVNPKKLLEECVELIAPAANDKGVMVVADVERDTPPVPLDPDGLHQAVMNLLSNALDAVSPHEGLIRLVGKYDGENKQLLIEVIDNGTGIAEPMMRHMFELFHSTKGNRGTGLGLAVTKKIVEEHEGSISVQSKLGEGTTFTLRLPVEHSRLADPSHTHGPAR